MGKLIIKIHKRKSKRTKPAYKKLPISLLKNPLKEKRANLLDVEKYEEAFGKKATRKRPKLGNYTVKGILNNAEER